MSHPRLLAVATTLAIVVTACGPTERQGEAARPRDLPPDLAGGRWSPVPSAAPGSDLSSEQVAEIERLSAIGYAAGVRAAPEVEAVTVHDPERSHAGLNLYTSGHAPEALLIDMRGRVLHRWRYDYERLWPDLEVPEDALGKGKWRRAHLYPNGDLLAIHEGIGMIKLDRDSRLLWEYPGHTHHDLEVMPDGTIWTLSREVGVIPRVDPEEPSVDDLIVHLAADGRELSRLSILEVLERSSPDLVGRMPPNGMLFHTNSLEILDGRLADALPAFAAGRALVSFRSLDAIAVIDLSAEEVVWSLTGSFRQQHDPTVLDNGHLLLFDNLGPGEGQSAILEIDPQSGEVAWEYRGSAERPFYSSCCGTSYRLPNGNTLITETDGGRAFEVTPAGDVVWEYYNPHRAGDELQYIASLYDVRRFPESYGFDWLEAPPAP